MRFDNLHAWLNWQERLHPNPIDMGLERVAQVLATLSLARPPYRVLTVGGTNGKGSCVSYLEAMLRAAGYRVGAYTSPHLLHYNERVRVDGIEATDQEFCDAFARVDGARGDTSLTYFEFGTLAAFDIFVRRGVQVAVLEVGMGGRLDAVNTLDPESALVTSIGLDHQEWLGPDRESIGHEKAGIYRRGRPALCGDRDPPRSLLQHAASIGAELRLLGRDFDWQATGKEWAWRGMGAELHGLPPPALPGRIQYDNAASAIAVLQSVRATVPVPAGAIRQGLQTARLPARFQRMAGEVECILDVAHNPDAARVLAQNLATLPAGGRTFGVMGMFRDKAVEEVARALGSGIQHWFAATLEGPRGQAAAALATRIRTALPQASISEHASVADAHTAALAAAQAGDRLVVFGSFQTVAAALKLYSPRAG